MKKNNDNILTPWYKKKSQLALVVILGVSLGIFIVEKNGPSACDCANLYDNSPMSRDYTPQQLNDADFLQGEADEYVEQAKNCAIQYGNLNEMEEELAKTTLEMNRIPKLDQAIENAKKECATKKEFNKNDLEIACDCWNQSVEKSGMAFDDMNSNQQAFRQKCFKVFGDEASMKAACENASKK